MTGGREEVGFQASFGASLLMNGGGGSGFFFGPCLTPTWRKCGCLVTVKGMGGDGSPGSPLGLH
jgi:hypothetical protein